MQTNEELLEIAKKYTCVAEMVKQDSPAYCKIKRRKLLKLACGHFKPRRPARRSDQELVEIARKYTCAAEMKKHHDGVYVSILNREGLRFIAFAHFVKKGNGKQREVYAYIFEDNSCCVGLTHDPEKRIKQHLTDKRSSIFKKLKCASHKRISFGFYSEQEASKKEGEIENYYKLQGYEILGKKIAGGLGAVNRRRPSMP